jgi:hypothetical protein
VHCKGCQVSENLWSLKLVSSLRILAIAVLNLLPIPALIVDRPQYEDWLPFQDPVLYTVAITMMARLWWRASQIICRYHLPLGETSLWWVTASIQSASGASDCSGHNVVLILITAWTPFLCTCVLLCAAIVQYCLVSW